MSITCCDIEVGNRSRTGPTGRKEFMILVDSCSRCGKIFPVHPCDLNHYEWNWVLRYNRRIDNENPINDFIKEKEMVI